MNDVKKSNKGLDNIKRIIYSSNSKDFILAIFVLLFIASPLFITYISFINHFFGILDYANKLNDFNLDVIIVASSLISLIINNWIKYGDVNKKEEQVKLIAQLTFTLSLAIISVFSFFISYFSIINNYILFGLINTGIFITSSFGLCKTNKLMKKFENQPNSLYAILWSILLITYIVYKLFANSYF